MKKIDLFLSDAEREKLFALAKSRGKTPQDCLREMIAASHIPGWAPETSRPRSSRPPPPSGRPEKPNAEERAANMEKVERALSALGVASRARGAAVSRENGCPGPRATAHSKLNGVRK